MVSAAAAEADCRERGAPHEQGVWRVLRTVMDPEIPVVSVVDLGIVRYVRAAAQRLCVGITPTYCGCPATEVIEQRVRDALARHERRQVTVETVLSPPWSSDWITAEGRRRLQAFGIAAPAAHCAVTVSCPHCASGDVQCVSEFGSTPCKAHYRCRQCLEPFDVFKCI